jgi:DNA-binding response OmpR family regulator
MAKAIKWHWHAFDSSCKMKKRIIIAEDDPDLLSILVAVLQSQGYEVLGLPDGSLIMEGHCESPDLFILDKDMDYYDGISIARYIRNDSDTSNVPIIMVSAGENTEAAIAAGIDLFIAKPFQQKAFLNSIRRLLSSPHCA